MTIRNLVVLMCDALRYDYMPDLGIKTSIAIAPSLYTSISLSSLITAREPQNHNVRTWQDVLDPRFKTIFDLFENKEYYDHPYDVIVKVLGFEIGRKPRELLEMKEPFIWFERLMETHIPYGKMRHGNKLPKGTIDGEEYIKSLKRGKLDSYKEYRKGVRKVEEHIKIHLNELEKAGLTERTLIIICADHGEILNRIYPDVHNWPPCRQLVEVPVVFIPEQNVSSCMRLIDVFPTALDLMGLNPKLGDGKSCVGINRNVIGTNMAGSFVTRWKCSRKGIKSLNPLKTILPQLLCIIVGLLSICLSRVILLKMYNHVMKILRREQISAFSL